MIRGLSLRTLLVLLGVLLSTGISGAALHDHTSASLQRANSKEIQEIRQLLDKGSDREAEAAARSLLLRVESENGPESVEVARVIDLLLESLRTWSKRNEQEVLDLAERAVAITEKLLGPEHPETARSMRNLGLTLQGRADFLGAKARLERALEIYENSLGPDTSEVASTLGELADLLHETEDFPKARALLERALAINERIYGGEHPDVAAALSRLGTIEREMGNHTRSRELHERALAIREKVFGPVHPEVARSLNNLAGVHFETGDWPEARRLLTRAISIWESVYGREHRRLGAAALNMGHMLLQIGDYSGAKDAYERGLAIFEKLEGSESPNVATALGGLASTLSATGAYEQAKTVEQRALVIREKAMGSMNPALALDLTSLAKLLCKTGDYPEALRLWDRAIPLLVKADAPPTWLARVLLDKGDAQLEEGDFAGARETLERALVIREKILGENHPDVAPVLLKLARMRGALGETQQAFALSLRAERIARNHLELVLKTVAERQALGYASTRSSGLDLALTLGTNDRAVAPDSKRELWDALIRSRALVLDEMAGRHRVIRDGDPEIESLSEALASAREQLANLVVRGLGSLTPEGYRRLVDQARQEREKAERTLAEKSDSFRADLGRRRAGLDDVAAALPPDSALVAFVLYHRYQITANSAAGKLAEPTPSYLAFVLQSGDREPVLVPLRAADRVDALVSRWGGQLEQEALAPGRSSKRTETTYRIAAAELRLAVWDPVVPHLGKAKRVFVVPDGALHLVNFAAMPVGRAEYLIEAGPRIHYLSAERDLVPLGSQHENQGLLALGAPAFDDSSHFAALGRQPKKSEVYQPGATGTLQSFRGNRSACGTFKSMRFEPLPASAIEVEHVVAFWKQAESPGAGEGTQLRGILRQDLEDVLYLHGAEATELGFKQYSRGKRVLHLATHGFFLGGGCPSPGKSSEGPSTDTPWNSQWNESPLLSSGLVLAGANHHEEANEDEEDGILTSEEIAALDLSGVEWAVLSACDTGIGEVMAGEGVLGLRRAFQVAGVRTLIMSLWPVEDKSVQAWMTELYRSRLVERRSTIDAVHQASLKILRQRRAEQRSTHPFYWGAFVAAGDWR